MQLRKQELNHICAICLKCDCHGNFVKLTQLVSEISIKDILRHIAHQMQNRIALVRACFGGWKGDGSQYHYTSDYALCCRGYFHQNVSNLWDGSLTTSHCTNDSQVAFHFTSVT
jgi:hypothetical protein